MNGLNKVKKKGIKSKKQLLTLLCFRWGGGGIFDNIKSKLPSQLCSF